MDVTSLSLEQLKALAYDQIVASEVAQKNLQVLNQRIVELSKVPNVPIEEDKPSNK